MRPVTLFRATSSFRKTYTSKYIQIVDDAVVCPLRKTAGSFSLSINKGILRNFHIPLLSQDLWGCSRDLPPKAGKRYLRLAVEWLIDATPLHSVSYSYHRGVQRDFLGRVSVLVLLLGNRQLLLLNFSCRNLVGNTCRGSYC